MPLILPDSRNIPCSVRDSTSVTTEALRGLNADTLVHEIKRLQDSVARLQDSNRQIEQFVHESGDDLNDDDHKEMDNACHDNQGTIARQNDVVSRLFSVLGEKTSEAEMQDYYGLTLPQRPDTDADGNVPMQEDQSSSGVFL